VEQFSHKSITTDDFKSFLFEYFGKMDGGSKLKILETVDWESWFHKPGMPPVDIGYDRFLADKCQSLADLWLSSDESTAITPEVYNSMFTNQRVMFLDRLVQKAPVSLEILAKMDQVYSLTGNNNAEVKFKWQCLCLASGKTDIFPHVVKFITSAGRMKYVRPLYRALHSFPGSEGKSLAKNTFLENRDFYHPICEAMVAKDLGL
jgi:leukotriene-A4 hydrolase